MQRKPASASRLHAQRRCAVCGGTCGGDFIVPDLDVLRKHGLLCSEPRAGGKAYACRICRGISGLESYMAKFALCAAGGQLSSLKRLYPGHAALLGVHSSVWAYIECVAFKDTRHGAADYKLDRMSLYITGVVADHYDDKLDLFFVLFFLRLTCNDSTAAQRLLRLWYDGTGSSFGMSTWDEGLALAALKVVWRRGEYGQGYTARFLPSYHWAMKQDRRWLEEPDSGFRAMEQACAMMTSVHQHLRGLSSFPWTWSAPKNDRVLLWIQSCVGNYKGFWPVVLARDMQHTMGEHGKTIFNIHTCLDIGDHAEEGLNIIWPRTAAQTCVRSRLLHTHMELMKRLPLLLGEAAVQLLPEWDVQSTERCLCDYMQQWDRAKHLPSRERRSDAELQFFFRTSAPRFHLVGVAPSNATNVSAEEPSYSDEEVLLLLRYVATGCAATAGHAWPQNLIRGFLSQMRASRLPIANALGTANAMASSSPPSPPASAKRQRSR